MFPYLAFAQGNLLYGQTVTGRITNDDFRVLYTFEGREGDIVEATLTRTSGNLDPLLILTDDGNNLLAFDDDGSIGEYASKIKSTQLKKDGLYFLIATRFGQERGLTTGDFSLKLDR